MFKRIPFDKVNWVTSSFLIGTLFLSLTAVPAYIYFFGVDWFQVAMFLFFFAACGFSITLGYHRLFAHLAFQAHPIVRALVLFFGAGAFENSALMWACEHRTHHKHVDHEEDPYDVSKGLFHAHIGWLIFKLDGDIAYENVPDLKRDKMVMFQHKYVQWIAMVVTLVLPGALGYWHGGWSAALGGALIAGIARVVFLQHCTFCINSLCHYIGKRPYSTRCSARDSWLMAIFTFGEGYHNYHHEFQHDYRNGVKPWQFDPTKWIIWTLAKVGLADKLRRVPSEKILLSELAEAQRTMESKLDCPHLTDGARAYMANAYARIQATAEEWAKFKDAQMEITREMLAELRQEVRAAVASLKLREEEMAAAQAGA